MNILARILGPLCRRVCPPPSPGEPPAPDERTLGEQLQALVIEIGTIVHQNKQDPKQTTHNPGNLLSLHRHLKDTIRRDSPLLKLRRKQP